MEERKRPETKLPPALSGSLWIQAPVRIFDRLTIAYVTRASFYPGEFIFPWNRITEQFFANAQSPMRKRFIASRGLNVELYASVRHLSEVGAANKLPVEGLLSCDCARARTTTSFFVTDLIVSPYVWKTRARARSTVAPGAPVENKTKSRVSPNAPVRGGGWLRGWAPANLLSVFRVGAE